MQFLNWAGFASIAALFFIVASWAVIKIWFREKHANLVRMMENERR